MERWLSLKVQELNPSKSQVLEATVKISVPKRAVPLAVDRNRIRRVLREALRGSSAFAEPRLYVLKVLRHPESVNLRIAKEALNGLQS